MWEKVSVSHSRLAIKATMSGTIQKQMVHIRTSFPDRRSRVLEGDGRF